MGPHFFIPNKHPGKVLLSYKQKTNLEAKKKKKFFLGLFFNQTLEKRVKKTVLNSRKIYFLKSAHYSIFKLIPPSAYSKLPMPSA